MKKILLSILFVLLISTTSTLNAQAHESDTLVIRYGITQEGTTYQVYGEILSATQNSATVTRTIIYSGNITPSATISWTENIDGITYTGTLRLIQTKHLH